VPSPFVSRFGLPRRPFSGLGQPSGGRRFWSARETVSSQRSLCSGSKRGGPPVPVSVILCPLRGPVTRDG